MIFQEVLLIGIWQENKQNLKGRIVKRGVYFGRIYFGLRL